MLPTQNLYGGPPLVGCPQILIQIIRSRHLFPEVILSIWILRKRHAVVTRDPFKYKFWGACPNTDATVWETRMSRFVAKSCPEFAAFPLHLIWNSVGKIQEIIFDNIINKYIFTKYEWGDQTKEDVTGGM